MHIAAKTGKACMTGTKGADRMQVENVKLDPLKTAIGIARRIFQRRLVLLSAVN
jgi:hypothetical protein